MAQVPPAVRILPMSSEEPWFRDKSIEQVQRDFFLKRLAKRPVYEYRKSGLSARPGTIVLFQFAARIVAAAVLDRVERFDKDMGQRQGAMHFQAGSVRVFDPVDVEQMKKIWPRQFVTRGFSHTKMSLNPYEFPKFDRLVRPTMRTKP